jgi:hypothetical protein
MLTLEQKMGVQEEGTLKTWADPTQDEWVPETYRKAAEAELERRREHALKSKMAQATRQLR